MKWRIPVAHTFARFFRHSVHAVGVTTPWPLLRFDSCCAEGPGGPDGPPLEPAPDPKTPPTGVPDEVDEVGWPWADGPEGPDADDDGRDNSPACPPVPEPERGPLESSMVPAQVRKPD